MPITDIDPSSALVLIDLQQGITRLPTVDPADDVVSRAARMAAAFRERHRPVVLVNVAFSADGGDVVKVRTDAPAPSVTPSADWADLRPELDAAPADLRITKRGWDAFFGTELDLQLRRRGVTGIVLAGIATSIGVESTARHANLLGYELVIARDAVSDMSAQAQAASLEVIFPRIARLATTDEILAVH